MDARQQFGVAFETMDRLFVNHRRSRVERRVPAQGTRRLCLERKQECPRDPKSPAGRAMMEFTNSVRMADQRFLVDRAEQCG